MIQYNDAYQHRLNSAWKSFIAFRDADYSFLRPEILTSWKRSRDFHVNPHDIKTQLLDINTIELLLEKNAFLIQTVRPYMELLYSIVKGSGFYLMLCDKDGYILDLLGDEDIITDAGENSLLVIGANRSESFAGTNAIGTCLAIQKPIQIWNEEHYISSHKKYTCSGAPIFSPSGQIVGCLNLTGVYTKIHTHTLGMVLSAVDGISKELKIKNAYEEIEIINEQKNSILESVSSGLILLDKTDAVTQINGNALRMLRLNKDTAIGVNIFKLIHFYELNNSGFSFSAIQSEIQSKETTVYFTGSPSIPAKFNLSVSFVGKEHGAKGTVLRLEEPRHIKKIVKQFGGFKAHYTFENFIGSSEPVRKLLATCEKAAQGSSNVLILGESGTGKELIAQAIHNSSQYANGPFVAINCGAFPKGLIESELFGYEGGSFTGASKEGSPGKFELADGGTIFLDEIGDMPLDVQVLLLRVIQTKEIVRIGGKHSYQINVRIIAATNRDLKEGIEGKTFREDLYYRLNVLPVYLPPLRERGGDICELADYFVRTLNNPKNCSMRIAEEVYPVLLRYTWPGNIRELENAMERAINITDGDEIKLEHLMRNILENHASQHAFSAAPTSFSDKPENHLNLKSDEYQFILSGLKQTGGNVAKAAELLGISRRTLYRKMIKHQIDYQTYRK